MKKLNVLAVAPYCDGTDVGEAWCAFMWVKELAKVANVTVITQHRAGRQSLMEQVPNVRVLSRPEPQWATCFERLNAMAKLAYPGFYRWAKRVIKAQLVAGRKFDIGHQFSPIALRYPSPLQGTGIPYVIGPLGGSLTTPDAFKIECGSSAFFTRLRGLDAWRLRRDRTLMRSYSDASLILGVAPYVRTLLEPAGIQRFEVMSELGVSRVAAPVGKTFECTGAIRLLHVGRGVRTKGLRDVIRALAQLPDLSGIHLDVAGKGEEMPICAKLAADLGVEKHITFHGQISRSAVDELYRKADIFCFPSFREPSGSVVFEALSHGLPVIAADRGGPGHVIDDTCGIKIAVTNPKEFAAEIAAAIQTMASMPELRRSLSQGATAKMERIALWPAKINRLLELYGDVLQPTRKSKKEMTQCQKNQEFLPSRQVEATGSSYCA